ncbi:MAG: type II secretion system protein [Flammeovirgaceae bacterium]
MLIVILILAVFAGFGVVSSLSAIHKDFQRRQQLKKEMEEFERKNPPKR